MQLIKMKRIILLISFALFRGLSYSQDCSKIRTGKFYFYPRNSYASYTYLLVRGDSIQQEINYLLKDTSYWRIMFENPCTFNLNFLRSTEEMPEGKIRFFKDHHTHIKVLTVTDNYYTYHWSLDSLPTKTQGEDTVWIKPKN